jgi:hypothetical protein
MGVKIKHQQGLKETTEYGEEEEKTRKTETNKISVKIWMSGPIRGGSKNTPKDSNPRRIMFQINDNFRHKFLMKATPGA